MTIKFYGLETRSFLLHKYIDTNLGYNIRHATDEDYYYDHYDEEYGEDDDDTEGSGSGDNPEQEVLLLPSFVSRIQHLLVNEGDTFSLHCVVDNIGKLMLMWKKDDQLFVLNDQLLNSNKRMSVDRVENGNTVTVRLAERDDEGIYTCQVTHKFTFTHLNICICHLIAQLN